MTEKEIDTGLLSGAVDMVAAITILASAVIPVRWDFLLYFGIVVILKAAWDYVQLRTWMNPIGAIDLASGIIILLLYFGINNSLFFLVGLVQLVKGGFALTNALTEGIG
jgi:hypothetical protein